MTLSNDPLGYLGAPDATTNDKGVVELATVAETTAGTSATLACTPAGVAAVAIAGSPDASTTVKGIIEIATDGEAAAKTSGTLALVPSNLPDVMASPGAIGGTTAAAGTFTTLTATTLVFASPLDVAEGGTGLATITDHGIMVGSGTGAVTPLAVGTTGQLLVGATGADPAWATNVDLPGTLDVTGATTLDDTLGVAGATTISAALTANSLVVDNVTYDADAITSSSSLDVDAAGALSVNSSAGVINVGNDAVAQNINIGTGAAARTLTLGNITGATGLALNSGTDGIALVSTGAGDITLASSDTVLVDGAGVVEINSSAGVIGIGNDAVAQNINIGTGAAARTITMGNVSGATALALNSGTGGVAVVGTGAAPITVDTGAGISLDGATASNFTVTGAAADLTLSSAGGSVNITATEAAADAIVLNASNAAGGIDLLTGGGELTLSSAGSVSMVPATNSVAGVSLTLNARVGVATFTGQTTAAGSNLDLTITNSALGAGDGVFVTVSNLGTNDADMTLEGVITETAGSLVIHTQNNGAAALNGDVVVTFWIIN